MLIVSRRRHGRRVRVNSSLSVNISGLKSGAKRDRAGGSLASKDDSTGDSSEVFKHCVHYKVGFN